MFARTSLIVRRRETASAAGYADMRSPACRLRYRAPSPWRRRAGWPWFHPPAASPGTSSHALRRRRAISKCCERRFAPSSPPALPAAARPSAFATLACTETCTLRAAVSGKQRHRLRQIHRHRRHHHQRAHPLALRAIGITMMHRPHQFDRRAIHREPHAHLRRGGLSGRPMSCWSSTW